MPIHRAKTSEGRWGEKLESRIKTARDGLSTFSATYERHSNELLNGLIYGKGVSDPSSVRSILGNLYAYNREAKSELGILGELECDMDRSADTYVDLATKLGHDAIMNSLTAENRVAIRAYEHIKEIGLELSKKGNGSGINEDILCKYVDRTVNSLESTRHEVERSGDFPAFFESVYRCIRRSTTILIENRPIVRGLEYRAARLGVEMEPFDSDLEMQLITATLLANRNRNGKK